MNKNIVLIGFMGCGKSTIGRMLAQKLSYKWIDIDHRIEKQENATVVEIFAARGEKHFRKLESAVVQELEHTSRAVITTGGGTAENLENMALLRKNSMIIYLKCGAEILYPRISKNNRRPMADGKSYEEIAAMLAEREHFYTQCNCEIDISELSPLQTVRKILSYYTRF